jgi:hypothetical protein
MLSRLRRLGSALVLLLLSPGIGGMAARSLHFCPTSDVSVTQSGTGHHHGSPTAPAHQPDCQCVGSCHQSFTAELPAWTAAVVTWVLDRSSFSPLGRSLDRPVAEPLDRLPPPTAPPTA